MLKCAFQSSHMVAVYCCIALPESSLGTRAPSESYIRHIRDRSRRWAINISLNGFPQRLAAMGYFSLPESSSNVRNGVQSIVIKPLINSRDFPSHRQDQTSFPQLPPKAPRDVPQKTEKGYSIDKMKCSISISQYSRR